MTSEELRKLLQSEDERTEWKQVLKDSTGILQAVCALANDLGDSRSPGTLLIGVAKNGNVLGVNASGSKRDEEQQILASRLQSIKLLPRLLSISRSSNTRESRCSWSESTPILYLPSSR